MKYALDDRLHQIYRSRLITGFDEVKAKLAELPNVLGTVISGAGPTLLVIYEKDHNFKEIKSALNSVWQEMGLKAIVKDVDIDTEGAVIV